MTTSWKSNLRTFDPIVQELASRYRVVRLDLPGFGGSEFAGGDWTLDDYARFVGEFIKKLGIRVEILVGHSLGGRIIIKGLAIGIFHPQKVVLIASAGIAKRKTLRSAVILFVAKTGKAITAIPPFSLAREGLRKKLYRGIGSDYGDAGILKKTFLNIVREDLSESARGIAVPTLLVWGSQDTETPLTDGKRLSHLIPNSKLEVVPGTGHFVHREKPQEVVRVIQKFLAS